MSETGGLGPYPDKSAPAMVAYANFNQHCVDQALTEFMQYLPFIMLLQAVSIILIGNIQISWMAEYSSDPN